jgi:hypothetical protein
VHPKGSKKYTISNCNLFASEGQPHLKQVWSVGEGVSNIIIINRIINVIKLILHYLISKVIA